MITNFKIFEEYGRTDISLNLGEHVRLESSKAKPLGKKHPQWKGDGYDYFPNALNIEIFSDDEFCGALGIDERNFNIIHREDDDYYRTFHQKEKKSTEYQRAIFKVVSNYLIKLHRKMKLSNSKYGTYDSNFRTNQGILPLLVHHFFQFIEKDFKNNKKMREKIKDLEILKSTEKYNL